MLDRLVGACIAFLAAAVAIYMAVKLIESVAATLLVIVAVIGALIIAGFVGRVLWRRHRLDRW